MPDWKREVDQRLAGQGIEPGRSAAIIEELSQHLQDRYEELLSGGSSESEAYGRVLKELEDSDVFAAALPSALRRRSHDVRPPAELSSGNLALDLARDLRYGIRSMLRAPSFSFFAILTLALGIGASTTVFTLVNTLLLHPLPVQDPSHLVCVYTTDVKGQKQSGNLLPTSYLNLKDYQGRNTALAAIGGFSPPMVMTLSEGASTERFFGELVTSGYFETLGIAPAVGRFFLRTETSTPGSMPVAVLSYNAWKVRFQRAPDIVGKILEINGIPFTVVGVAPQGFLGVSAVFGPDVWLPATMATAVLPPPMQDILRVREKPFFQAAARLKPGVSQSQAQANLQAIASSLEREYPDANVGRTVSVEPVTEALFSSAGGARGMTFASAVLLGIVGLVLLIACSNVANLLMARAVGRRQEIAVRLAIGAGRGRLLRQLLTESLLLGIFGGVGGLGVGYEGCRFLWSFRPDEVARNLVDPRLDGTVFLFALLLSLATAFVFGVVPSLKASKTDLVGSLKEEARLAAPSGRSGRFQKVLLTGQVALSLISLVAAALFLRAVQRAYSINPGFDEKHLAVFLMNPEQVGYDATRLEAFHRDIRERVAAIPGIEAVSWAANMPFWSSPSRGVEIEGQAQERKSEALSAVTNTVDVDYFKVMGISLVQGRTFTEGDRENSLPVAIINEDLARRYWPAGDALGKRLRLVGDNTMRQIVGIVKNSDYTTLGEAPQPALFLPLRQNAAGNFTLYVRAAGDPASVLGEVQREIKQLAPKVEISDIRTGAKLIDQILWSARIVLGLLGVFGLLALTLASVGLYGLLAYSVRSRQREIGVRMALGASRAAVLRLVLRQGMMLVAIGVGIGLGVSLLIGRAFSRMLFGLSSADPLALIAASATLLLVAFLATYVPALTASRVEPMKALREG
ncbi:MAG TPA: ABC transporter permease [Terracidiphilus sp.]|nr:ABC transporter permease [Terracidiphilus sp.]